jgi:hypothetical protein
MSETTDPYEAHREMERPPVDEVVAGPDPLTIDEIREAVNVRHRLATQTLAHKREQSVQLNKDIAAAVLEEKEASRIFRYLVARKTETS